MNILLITDAYPPEVRSASQLMQELAEGLNEKGHKVFVITCYPKYNLTDEQRKRSYQIVTKENTIEVIRVKTLPHHNVNFIIRGISQLLLPFLLYYYVKKYIKSKIDIVIVYSPPLTLSKIGIQVKKRYNAKYILNVQDIFPQNAIDLGILNNKILITFFERLERTAYREADKIIVHSRGNKLFIEENRGIPKNKIHVINNWIDISLYDEVTRTGKFRREYGIDDKIVFLFGGVLGPSQGLDLIIKLAERLKEIPEICFLFVGDGVEKERLEKLAERLSLSNVFFKPFVAKEEYPELVKDSDVGLVCLTSKNKTPVVPGKILGYMAAGVPIAAFLNKESDAHSIISASGCGYAAISDDEESAYQIIWRICREKSRLKSLGENGYKYVRAHFEKDICLKALEKLFDNQ